MTNKQALEHIDEVYDIVRNSFGGWPYTDEEETILDTLDAAKDALRFRADFIEQCKKDWDEDDDEIL